MKVQISSTESYWIVWNYPKKEVIFNQGEPDERIEKHPIGESFCFIYDDTVQGEPKLVATGIAICGLKDRFIRNEGRLLSFQRAVKKIAEKDSEKYERFWQKYYNRVPSQVYIGSLDTKINRNGS